MSLEGIVLSDISWSQKTNSVCSTYRRYFYHRTKFGFSHPTRSKASLLTPICGEGKYSINCKVSSKENKQLMFKRPELPDGFQGRVFKGNIRAEGYRGSPCLTDGVGGQQGDVLGMSVINLVVPTSLGSMCWWAACS